MRLIKRAVFSCAAINGTSIPFYKCFTSSIHDHITGQLLLPSYKSGIHGLWARMISDAVAENDVIPQDATESGANLTLVNERVEKPMHKIVNRMISKKLKIETKEKSPIFKPAKRMKVALLLAYCGHEYYGMTWNSTRSKTIETDLLTALLKAELIGYMNYKFPNMMHYRVASRTDKGVSAVGQVVSMNILKNDIENKDLVEKINVHLPPEIRVLNIKKTAQKFNSRNWCDSRTYSYTLPTFAFAPVTEKTTEDYRINENVIERLKSVLSLFKGTHKFHNYTSKRNPDEEYVNRSIMEFKSGEPFVDDGLELITITVKSKGYMLHQIRKMIAITIHVLRDFSSMDIIEKSWTDEKMSLPIAPAVGLTLERADYNHHNRVDASDGHCESIEWDDLDETIDNFKRSHIRPALLKAEKQEKSMLRWLSNLSHNKCEISMAFPLLGRTAFGWAAKIVVYERIAKKNLIDELPGEIETKTESLT